MAPSGRRARSFSSSSENGEPSGSSPSGAQSDELPATAASSGAANMSGMLMYKACARASSTM